MILECRNNSKRLLLPIFYHVDPSDVRKQSGCISEAIDHYEESFQREVDETKRKNLMDKMKRWRTALTQLANLGGMPLQNVADGFESKIIQKAVNLVKDKVTCNPLIMTQHSVGIDSSVQDITSWLRNGSSDVEVFALYGVGGLGKTTVAKYVYHMNLKLFEGHSFLENIRESSESSHGLVSLQRQLISDISKGKTPTIKDLNDGILKIRNALHHRKLLIVLDDVDKEEQLDAVFGLREWFHQGSKIIITTRNVHLLNAYEHCTRYAVKTLSSDDSLKLFTWHAFQDSRPPECYIEYAERIVQQCEGLPLALKVLGASLRGKKIDVWRSAIEKLEVIPHCRILKVLRISYDSLQDDHDRDLFLEIACFFCGETKSFVVGVLDECDYYTLIGIDNLIDRCLLKIDKYGNLKMHQSIQSMGREIIRQQSPRHPGQRSRLWHYKDSLKVLKDETGAEEIEGLALEMNTINAYEAELRTKAFSMMHKLRILKLNNARLIGGYKDFPKYLKWFSWHKCPLWSLPNDFPQSNLVAIDLQSSKLKYFNQGNMPLGSLKFLNLSHCHGLVKSPDFAKLYALEQLYLEDCASLIEIDESIGMAEGLVLINLKDCKLLKKLPENLCMLKLLETLNISGCSSLGMFRADMRKMESLKFFFADGLNFGKSSDGLESCTNQKVSWREFIWGFVSRPSRSPKPSLTSLPFNSITNLSLIDCNLQDSSFPKDFRVSSSLQYLNLSLNPIRFLPDCFKRLEEIKHLELGRCNQLQTLEGLPHIEFVHVFCCRLLEKITWKPGQILDSFYSLNGCEKLLETHFMFNMAPIDEIEPELISNCGICDVESMKVIQITLYNRMTSAQIRCSIQGVHELTLMCKSFNIFYPGSSVPTCFTNQSYGGQLSFVVSHAKLRCFNTCIVYKMSPGIIANFDMVYYNKTKEMSIVYYPLCYGIPEGDEYMTWICHWKLGAHEVGPGDEVMISISKHVKGFEVKEIGVYLVYEEQEQEGFHLTKRRKIQQTCEEISQYVIPAGSKPSAYYGTTQLYLIGRELETIDRWVEKYVGNCLEVETGEPSSPHSEVN